MFSRKKNSVWELNSIKKFLFSKINKTYLVELIKKIEQVKQKTCLEVVFLN